MLDSLLGEYRRHGVRHPETKHHGKEARSTFKQLRGLHDRLNEIASEIEQLQAKRLDFLCGQTLVNPLFRHLSPIDTTLFRSEAEKLKRTADHLDRAGRLTVWPRKDARRAVIAIIYVCCCYVPWERKKARAITYSDVADLLNEYEAKMGIADPDNPVLEDAVRKAVKRDFTRRKLREQRCQPTVSRKMVS